MSEDAAKRGEVSADGLFAVILKKYGTGPISVEQMRGVVTKWIDAVVAKEYHRDVAEARREEREACAMIADHGGPDAPWNGRDQEELDNLQHCASRIAAAIRSRANPCDACKAAGFPECHGPHLTGPPASAFEGETT